MTSAGRGEPSPKVTAFTGSFRASFRPCVGGDHAVEPDLPPPALVPLHRGDRAHDRLHAVVRPFQLHPEYGSPVHAETVECVESSRGNAWYGVSWRFGDQEEVHYKNRLFRLKEWRECITRQRNRDRASVFGMRDLNEKL
jgi:hypothetical protein